jgi:hypothetical protein
MDAEYKTFDGVYIFYRCENPGEQVKTQFDAFSREVTEATGVVFIEVADDATERVQQSEAAGLITLKAGGIDYYRSQFNEPDGGKIVRGLFERFSFLYAYEAKYFMHIKIKTA